MSDSSQRCAVCNISSSFQCSNCHSVSYCGNKHQKEDWLKHKKSCRAYEILTSPSVGRHVVAARNIEEGEVIVSEMPLLLGAPHYNVPNSCPGCCEYLISGSKRCPQCEWPICKLNCAGLKDPSRHGLECAALSKIKSFTFMHSSGIILPLRCLLIQKNDPKKWKIIEKMAKHAVTAVGRTNASRETEILLQRAVLEPLKKVAPEMLPDCSPEKVKQVFALLDFYGLGHEPRYVGSLLGVFAVTSCMEHSCMPNTTRSTDWVHSPVVVRASKRIRKGEHITTIYMDTLMSTYERQHSLWSRRKVFCKCDRCMDPRELGADCSTMKCQNCEGGWVVPVDLSNILESDWKCIGKCGRIYCAFDIMITWRTFQGLMEKIRQGDDQDVKIHEELLDQLQKMFHPKHNFCMLVKRRLCSEYGSKAILEAFAMSMSQLQRLEELCEEVIEALRNPLLESPRSMLPECLMWSICAKVEIAIRNPLSKA